MRKLITLLLILSAVSALILARSLPQSSPDSSRVDSKPRVAVPQAIHVNPPDIKVQALDKAYATTQSLQALENQYQGVRQEDLESEIEKSKIRLSDPTLTNHGDSGQLTEQEAIVLLTEVRRQHVLNTLLVKRKIESLRRANL